MKIIEESCKKNGTSSELVGSKVYGQKKPARSKIYFHETRPKQPKCCVKETKPLVI
jgi:hypothetical protein